MSEKKSTGKGIARRGFLKGAAVVAAAAGDLIAANRTAQAAGSSPAKSTRQATDLCIIGGAGAG